VKARRKPLNRNFSAKYITNEIISKSKKIFSLRRRNEDVKQIWHLNQVPKSQCLCSSTEALHSFARKLQTSGVNK
jgi:hypothetical protein